MELPVVVSHARRGKNRRFHKNEDTDMSIKQLIPEKTTTEDVKQSNREVNKDDPVESVEIETRKKVKE